MHRAWLIVDIQYLFIKYLEQRDLAVLARTCQALHSIATEALWETLIDFESFVSVLPPDFGLRPLVAKDLQRLDHFSRLVKYLLPESKDADVVIRLPGHASGKKKNSRKKLWVKPSSKGKWENRSKKTWQDLWQEIRALRPQSEFLPNLRRLRFSNADERLLLPLIGISGTYLTEIYIKHIHYRQYTNTVYEFLDSIQDISRLYYLLVRDGEPDLVPLRLIRDPPLQHLRLEPRIVGTNNRSGNDGPEFKLYPLRPEILQKHSIEKLSIGLTQEWYSEQIKTLQGRFLPKLQTLRLQLGVLNDMRAWETASPVYFFEKLDHPELRLLRITFPYVVTGKSLIDVLTAANANCRLENLIDLSLSLNERSENYWGEFASGNPPPKVYPRDLRIVMDLLSPMPHLKSLALTAAPNFLEAYDMHEYKLVTDGFPNLEILWLGHSQFAFSGAHGASTHYYERIRLDNLAAFCSLLPKLREVSVGCLDQDSIGDTFDAKWTSFEVKKLKIWYRVGVDAYSRHWSGEGKLLAGLSIYFPHADLTESLRARQK
jgi:hypothetical protein